MIKTIEPYTPLQYIVGREKFCDLDFVVNKDVLIPRPETEILVETVMDIMRSTISVRHDAHYNILDLCTGSGNIAITLAVQIALLSSLTLSKGLTKSAANCRIVASDISAAALSVAKENARLNGVFENIEFKESDLFCNIDGKFDIIVSNPPYIAQYEFETLQKEVLKEPRIALDGGQDGLDFYKKIFSEVPGYLKENGRCVVEIGFGQLSAVTDIIDNAGIFKLSEVKKDQYGIDRVVVAQWIN